MFAAIFLRECILPLAEVSHDSPAAAGDHIHPRGRRTKRIVYEGMIAMQ